MELEWPMGVEFFVVISKPSYISSLIVIMLCFFGLPSILGLTLIIYIVGIYKNFIGLLDGRYQIIVWSYWHGHLHCLCTLATQVWSMSTKNYMHEAYSGGHQRRTKGVDDSCITYIGINGHANFLLHGWTEFL